MEKSDLLSVIEAQITRWDFCLGDHAIEFFQNELEAERATCAPLEIRNLGLPCTGLATMANECLVAFTGYHSDCFESKSDCCHARTGIANNTSSPPYVEGLLDIRLSCLFILEDIKNADRHDREGYAAVIRDELCELIQRIKKLHQIVESRHWLERDLVTIAQSEKSKRAKIKAKHSKKMKAARDKRPPKHDWDAVEILVAKLLAGGTKEHNLAVIICSRKGIPRTTFRDWRRKKTTV